MSENKEIHPLSVLYWLFLIFSIIYVSLAYLVCLMSGHDEYIILFFSVLFFGSIVALFYSNRRIRKKNPTNYFFIHVNVFFYLVFMGLFVYGDCKGIFGVQSNISELDDVIPMAIPIFLIKVLSYVGITVDYGSMNDEVTYGIFAIICALSYYFYYKKKVIGFILLVTFTFAWNIWAMMN